MITDITIKKYEAAEKCKRYKKYFELHRLILIKVKETFETKSDEEIYFIHLLRPQGKFDFSPGEKVLYDGKARDYKWPTGFL